MHRILLLTAIFLVAACSPSAGGDGQRPAAAAPAPAAAPEPPEPRNHTLTIVGYNYTDRYIDSFDAAGQGGGNLFLSGPSSGGGGGTCCIGFWSATPLPKKIKVDWTASYCKLTVKGSHGETFVETAPFWRTADAYIHGPIPDNPGYLEVHFYKDGHVEVAVTTRPSPPRLQLPDGDNFVRPGTQAKDPPCPPDYDRVREWNRVR